MSKRKQPEINERLNHIIEAINDIFEFTATLSSRGIYKRQEN